MPQWASDGPPFTIYYPSRRQTPPGLRQLIDTIREVLPEAVWQRCYVHFLRNALDYVPRKVDDDCLMELRWFYDRRDLAEVKRDLAQWIAKWQAKYPKLVNWVEDKYRGDAELLSAAACPPQAHEVDEHAGAAEPGDQAAHPGRSHLPQPAELSAAGSGAGRGDPRELARGDPLSQYGSPARAQEGELEGIGRLGAAACPPRR